MHLDLHQFITRLLWAAALHWAAAEPPIAKDLVAFAAELLERWGTVTSHDLLS